MPIGDPAHQRAEEGVPGPDGPQIDPIEILPGYTYPTDPPQQSPESSDLAERLSRAEAVVGQAVGTLSGAMTSPIDRAREAIGQAESIIRGQIGAKLDRVNETLGKAVSKVRQAINEPMARAFGYLAPLGVQVPTPEALAYAANTGDYIGAYGLRPQSVQIPMAAADLLQGANRGPSLEPLVGPPPAPLLPGGQGGQEGPAECVDFNRITYRSSWADEGLVTAGPGADGTLPARLTDIPPGQCGYQYMACARVGNQEVPVPLIWPYNLEPAVGAGGVPVMVTTPNATFTRLKLWPGSIKGQRVCNNLPPPGPPPLPDVDGPDVDGPPIKIPPGCLFDGQAGWAPTYAESQPISYGGQVGHQPWLYPPTLEERERIKFQCWLPFCAGGQGGVTAVGRSGLPGGGESWGLLTDVVYSLPGHTIYTSPDGYTVGSFVTPPDGWIKATVTEVACAVPPPPPPPPPPGGEKCPVPPKIDCGADVGATPKLFLDDIDLCKSIDELLRNFKFTSDDLASMFRWGTAAGAAFNNPITMAIGAMFGGGTTAIPDLWNRLIKWLGDVITQAASNDKCNAAVVTPFALSQAAIALIQKYTAAIPPQVMATNQYLLNAACPYNLPSGPEADQIYLGGEIDRQAWECLQRANGNQLATAEKVMEVKRGKVTPDWLVRLKMRGKLTDADFRELVRREGYIRQGDINRLEASLEAWPGLDDVIRFLVRDVDDAGVVQRFGMDDGFREKWGEKLADYGRGAGVGEDLARLYWRAHWRLPSPTQLYEMAHRLRPGRVPEEVQVTLDDLKTALTQDDLLPFWIDREIAIAYRPVTRTDAKAAFQVRAITDEEFVEQLQDVGYSKEDAGKLLNLESALRRRREAQQSGLPTIRGLAAQFASGALTEANYRDLLQQLGRPPEAIDVAVNNGRIIRATKRREAGIKANRQGYLTGVLDDQEAQNNLLQIGMAPEIVNELTAEWRELRKARGKMAPANMLCQWRWRNLINAAQHQVALERVGWSPDDARKIVLSCEFDLSERAQRQAEAAAERERRRRERAEAEERRRERERIRLERQGGPQMAGSSQG